MSNPAADPIAVIEALIQAINDHDLQRLAGYFAADYALEAPAHPGRAFRGREQVRRNWSQIFGGVPDITTRLLRTAVDGEAVWTELEMSGTRRDGAAHRMRGVFIFGVSEGEIRWGRMFLEPVEESGDIDAVIRAQVKG